MKKQILYILLQFAVMLGFGQVYHVGDLYTAEDGSQGIVFFVRADGGGWAVALHDEESSLPWSTTAVDIPALPNYGTTFAQAMLADTAGYTNTQQIRNSLGPGNHYAAGAVDFEHGWYLPAIGQLAMIYAQLPLLQTALITSGGTPLTTEGTFFDIYGLSYWSSTEATGQQAGSLSFVNDPVNEPFLRGATGTPHPYEKQQPLKVRAVCSFPPPHNVYDSTLTYQWNTGSTEPHFRDVPLQNTTYTVTVSNAYGCTNTASANVTVIDNDPQTLYDSVCQGSAYNNYGFTLSAEETAEAENFVRTRTISTANCEGQIMLFLTVLPRDTVYWEQSAEQFIVWNGVTYSESGTYSQHFNNQAGCDSVVFLQLTIHDTLPAAPDTISIADTLYIFLPNAITPSISDGLNDYFCLPEAYPPLINNFEISIFSRWGELVYYSTDKNFRWNGEIRGKTSYKVVYNYLIRFHDIMGRPYLLTGSITVL
jgi:gliding motility-associated-like protein